MFSAGQRFPRHSRTLWRSPRKVTHLPPVWDILLPLTCRVHNTALGPDWFRNATGRPCSHLFHWVRSFRNEPTTIAVERFRNGSGWPCGVNAQPDAFRSRLTSPCVVMKNMQYIFPNTYFPYFSYVEKSTYFDGYVDFGTRVETFGTCVESGRNSKTPSFPIFVIPKSQYLRKK